MASYSGFWNGVGDMANYSMLVDRSVLNRSVGRVMKRRGMIRPKEVYDTVVAGSSINGAAAVTYTRVLEQSVVGQPATNGGVRTIETVEKIAAAQVTTAADAALVDSNVAFESQPTYPVDASGNGGGGEQTKRYPL